MDSSYPTQCTAFAGVRRIASGDLVTVARAAREVMEGGEDAPVLIFDDVTSRVIDVDFRGSPDDVAERLTPPGGASGSVADATGAEVVDDTGGSPYRDGIAPRGRGRPKLGVVAREVTLLPRHWDWLATQPGGASAAVRRLVDDARQTYAAKDGRRQAQESAYRFMSAMAGNEPGFEEAIRALFANDPRRFTELTEPWPRDVRDHARTVAAAALA